MIGLLAVAIAFIITGFAANKKQGDSFLHVNQAIDGILAWVESILDDVSLLTDDISDLTARVLQSDCTGTGADFSQLQADANDILTQADSISSQTNDADFAEIKSQFGNQVNDVDTLRAKILLGTLIALIVAVVLQCIIALLNAYGPEGCRPNTNCLINGLSFLLAIINVFLILLLWIVAGVVFVIVCFTADYCDDSTTNLLNVTGLSSQPVAVFYFTCNEIPPPAHPYQSEIDDIQTKITDVQAAMTSLATNFPGTCTTDLTTIVDSAVGHADINTGLLSRVQCAELNNIYLLIDEALCSDLGPSLANFFEVFVALACSITIIEFIKRKLETKKDVEESFSA
eukprot:m.19799 g.19799  ORF g.19799 m.19799 type:complete len:343 (-) comp31357_c0_seq1:120-1148(-)